jgi:ribosomal protein S18 acetylase RimI-like enzyme
MSEVVIRRATTADLPALGRLGAALVELHHAFDPQRFLTPMPGLASGYAAFLGGELADPDVALFVATRGDHVLGYVYAGLEPQSWKELREPAGFIHDVVVEKDARGAGIGSMLVEAAAKFLEERGAPRILLWAAERNEDSRRLFEKLGFRRTMVEMTRERTG